ncbi:16S rRNA (adenine(1518)-N(6)/adenine(1519)-N(6))-dimethyltransferase [Candidatus Bathyarchaeota archaeon]|nr:16S rRNA (adenine(1518)-N(6)/adenine(1519)-N(6))-dimethyltransferase [Candidatus Bathyarchaeota archaeon]
MLHRTQTFLSTFGIDLDPALDEQQLIDEDIIDKLIDFSGVCGDDVVLEIGPGVGNITEGLLRRAKAVTCIEKNPKYILVLRERFKHYPQLEIVLGDALHEKLPSSDRLVSNLPYMICEALLQRLFRMDLKSAALIVPRGFAKILEAKTGEPEYSKLSLQAHLFYDSEIYMEVPPSAYLPEPKTETCIISLVPKASSMVADEALKQFLMQSDKLVKNALREALIRVEMCDTKRQSVSFIAESDIPSRTLGRRVSRLSLMEIKSLGNWLRTLAD